MAGTLRDQVALVTGAGRPGGLGRAIAASLLAEGAQIVLHDRGSVSGELAPRHGVGDLGTLEQTAEELRQIGNRVTTVTGDLLSADDIEAIMGVVEAKHGRLDILVNNAGIGYLFGPLADMNPDHLDAVLGVNLRAPFLLSKAAIPLMRKGGRGGRIVNIASQAAKSGFAFATAYTASKHGLLGLTRALALELGADGITVNAVCPNHVTTGLGAWQNEFMSNARGQSLEDYMDEMRGRIPLGRPGLPEDTAATVAFLCRAEAAYITAEAINISGGEEYH